MEKITYILGAGFSAPAGLPVMSNFILKAKELYYTEPDKYNYFLNIIKKIDALSKIKNFFSSDLYNIEEVLSLFETQALLDKNTKFKNQFIQFIIDVIEHYTLKPFTIKYVFPTNYHGLVFGQGMAIERYYSSFVGSLAGIRLRLLPTWKKRSK